MAAEAEASREARAKVILRVCVRVCVWFIFPTEFSFQLEKVKHRKIRSNPEVFIKYESYPVTSNRSPQSPPLLTDYHVRFI